MTTATLPNTDEAYGTLFENVHSQVFFGKLAQLGYTPTTDREAQDLLQIAANLRDVAGPEKAAASRFNGASQALSAVTPTSPAVVQQRKQLQDAAVKQAAAQLAQNPEIYNAVLALKAAEAAALASS